jgi:Tol biopolymer transport system component
MRLPALVSFVCLATSAAAQLPPAPVPTVFAPGVISGPADDADPAFSADGRTVVFARNGTLMISHLRGSAWSAPVIAPFSGQWMDQQPTMSPDGRFLVFVSNRPVRAGDDKRPAGHLWRVDRHGDGWGKPVDLGDAVNADGATDTNEARLGPDHRTLYFSTDRMSRPHYPRTPAQALADQARTAAWDNGRQNIWSVPLDAWLRDRPGATTAHAAGTP